MVLWEVLHHKLHYFGSKRRRFYDLILKRFFRLKHMSTENISFLMTKILRDLNVKNVDLVKMKEILFDPKDTIDGFRLHTDIDDCKAFVSYFESIEDVEPETWEAVYDELKAWKLDERLDAKILDERLNATFNEFEDSREYEITELSEDRKMRLAVDEAKDNDLKEKREWRQYRDNLKRIFIFFAGYKAKKMRIQEMSRFLEIFGIKQYWNNQLMPEDVITMEDFIKCLCNEWMNDKVKQIKKHIEQQPEWGIILNTTMFLQEIDATGNGDGILEFDDFQKFAVNIGLDTSETEILFDVIDEKRNGKIKISGVFKWYKKKFEERNKAKKMEKKQTKHGKSRRRKSRHSLGDFIRKWIE